jgi:SAM-dependent methyltransferase
MQFRRESLLDILAWIETQTGEVIAFEVLDPDLGRGRYAGELVEHGGEPYVHRPLRVWLDLAERLGMRLLTPRSRSPIVELRFERLDPKARLGAGDDEHDTTERYGAASSFARITKLEDPGFVLDLREALGRASLPEQPSILDLGVNTGDELALIQRAVPAARFVGIDHSASAIAVARERFPAAELHVADLSNLAALGLGRFDLVVSIGTLQSPGIDDRELVRRVVQEHLAAAGSVIFGFPNCRYVDGEIEYGTRMLNYRQPELGLLVKDVAFYRKYLQQHGRRVFVTGKHYVFVTGAR